MKSILKLALICILALGTTARAAERATPDEAVAMVKRAVAYLKANGKDKAYAEFNKPNGPFTDRDLYVFVIDMKGIDVAHGINPRIIGKNVIDLRDADGKPMVKAFIELAEKKGSGWVDYRWPNPEQKVVENKSTYLERVDDVFIACGIYKK
ncbi:MAG: cache domain-containing protein [Pseudomonadota bacterium]